MRRPNPIRPISRAALVMAPCAIMAAPAPQTAPPPVTEAAHFASPDAAAQALLKAAQSGDQGQMDTLFGPAHADLLSSGDAVEDNSNRVAFVAMAQEKLSTEPVGENRAILHAGATDWTFPIPLVKDKEGWRFDAEQGREEILNRRIGRDELRTLNVADAYVEAQFDYADVDRDGDGLSEYAQKLMSEPGKFDGLFWEAAPGQPDSPLGPLVAEARAEGYKVKGGSGSPTPYHGYFYRVLTRQGSAAPGGKYDYIINGNMIAGFGLVAFPAEYGTSGVMTFVVNHQGRIYQQDLGPKTPELARAMSEFNPRTGWQPVPRAE
ncbi:DUF2950 domain-containing protein [Methylomagnum sp.]